MDFIESRILGVLLEKENTTPDYYPMTEKGIEAACNQSSNRHPVTSLGGSEVSEAIQRMRDKGLVMKVHVSGSRVPKFEHRIPEIMDLSSAENALITVLLLRSQQTAGELKQRSERLHPFTSVSQVEEVLEDFQNYHYGALVKEFPAGGGRRVKTYCHLLGGEPALLEGDHQAAAAPISEKIIEVEQTHWRTQMEERMTSMESELATLREALGLPVVTDQNAD